jgi:hypothetical protein
MNNMRNKILSLLVLVMTAASGAWATSDISRALLSVPNSWEKDQNVFLTAEELPGFKAITEEEAAKWVPTDEDIENGAFLIYGFDAEGNMLSYATILGAPAVKNEPGKMPHNNMYALSHGSMLQVRFYYTSDVTLVGDKTEATFTMPAFDATVNYEIVRDMTQDMTTQVGDGTDGYRIRLKKNEQGEGYVPAEMTPQEMASLITVTDNIEQQDLTNVTDYTVQIFAVDEQGQIIGNAINFASLVPGSYVAVATAADGSTYDGSTDMSNVFQLYEGYEVTVPAGEFVTYYKDEALTVEDNEAQLYTITAVSETTATATPFDVIPANVPLLLKNNSSETRTILLIPTEDPLAFMHYSGFVGSVDPTTIAASTDTQTNYACNGKAFVYVKDAISAGANKAWLEIPASANGARQLKIVFADATTSIHNAQFTIDNGDWFDLNGRKLDKMPTKKGIYIQNGKKVVVK